MAYFVNYRGEKTLFVSSTSEEAESFVRTTIERPKAYLDALDSLPLEQPERLAEGEYDLLRYSGGYGLRAERGGGSPGD